MASSGTKQVIFDQTAILSHLDEILRSPAFRASQRSCDFLRFVVESTLAGESHLLKERTIGEKIFGRPADYDTGQDSIVRVKANEVRRRLAQYYDLHPNSPARIDLPTGSYSPLFHVSQPSAAAATVARPAEEVVTSRLGTKRWGLVALSILLAASAAALLLLRGVGPVSPFDTFWNPFFAGDNELRICVPTPEAYRIYGAARDAMVEAFRPLPPGATRPKLQDDRLRAAHVVPETGFFLGIGDAHSMSLLYAFTKDRGKTAQIRHGNETSFTELRAGPSILLGGFSNRWTIDLMKDARFTFTSEGLDYGIRDQNTGKFICTKQRSWEARNNYDCAVVARTIDSQTGHPLLVAGGLDHFGTYAVGEFLTQPELLEPALRAAGAGWETKHLQIVFRIEIMRDNIGPPKVLATHVW